jgi:hypothetical protein
MARKPDLLPVKKQPLPAFLKPPAALTALATAPPPEDFPAPTPRPELVPRELLLSPNNRVAAIAAHMAYEQMLRRHIVPHTSSSVDFGVDVLTLYGRDVMKRVQIKGQEVQPADDQSLTFPITRSKAPKSLVGKSRAYDPLALDAFIFVHIELRRYFVVPMLELARHTSSITFSPNSHSQWEDAWDVLMQGSL